jgi:hypothetical protein
LLLLFRWLNAPLLTSHLSKTRVLAKRYISHIVVASNLPIADRGSAEQKMAEAIQKKSGLRALAGMQVFPPT